MPHASSPEIRSPNPKPKAGWFLFAILCSLWSGIIITEQVSVQVLPLTLKGFTDDSSKIGMILSINAIFGMIAQPLAGLLSDRIWTPIGRRAAFLIVSAPIVATCLILIPEMMLFWHVIVLVVIYQFFQDILMGSDKPLMADLVPPHQRTLAAALIATSSGLSAVIFLRVLMSHFDLVSLYRIGAGCQVVMVCIAAFFLNERPRPANYEKPSLSFTSYFKDVLLDPYIRKFAFLQFTMALFFSVVGGFAVLFATETLGLTKGEFGKAWSYQVLIPTVFAIPTAIFIERKFSKRWAMVWGFGLGIIGCAVGWAAKDASFVAIAGCFMGIATLMNHVNHLPLFTEYATPAKVGQLAGAINVFYGIGRFSALTGAGFIIKFLGGDYRYIWPLGMLAGAAALLTILSIPDKRLEALRKSERQSRISKS